MSDGNVRVERDGHLTIVTLTRSERLNAIDAATGAELGEVFEDSKFEEASDEIEAWMESNCVG